MTSGFWTLSVSQRGWLRAEEISVTATCLHPFSPWPCRQDEKAAFKFTTCSRYLMGAETSACLFSPVLAAGACARKRFTVCFLAPGIEPCFPSPGSSGYSELIGAEFECILAVYVLRKRGIKWKYPGARSESASVGKTRRKRGSRCTL